MASSASWQALTEELTVQEVILQSLEGETFEGVEEERREAEEEVVRIKRALKALAAADARAAATSASQGHAATPRRSHSHTPKPSPAKRKGGPPTAVASPSGSQPSSAAIATPSRRKMEPDGWESPASLTLRSRKRDFGSANLHAGDFPNKSQRTTPTPAGNYGYVDSGSTFPPEWTDEVDIIDLTGPDVDVASNFVAEQINEANRLLQEKRDHDMAVALSSQALPLSSTDSFGFATTGADYAQPTAFQKIMGSQQSNAYRNSQAIDSDDDGEIFRPEPFGEADQPNPFQPAINPLSSQFDQLFEQQSLMQQPGYGSGFTLGSHGSIMKQPGQMPGAFPETFPGSFGRVDSSLQGSSPFSTPVPFGLSTPMPGIYPGLSTTPNFGRPSANHNRLGAGNPLAEVIHRTNMFDYDNGMDDFGNPFANRLRDFLTESFHDPRISETELDDLLKNIRPDMDIPERNRDGTPEGLKGNLYPHQTVALTWMKKMEEGSNKGGILADDMGLGKTISTLALMLSRKATSRPKTNLIIGPLALIRQWEEEIIKKTKASHRLSVFVYHNKKATTDDLLKYDVVLTTYGTIAQELKRLDKFHEDNADRSIDYNDKSIATKFPLLNPRKASFHRVILDEAQCIKNKETKTAKACQKLRATYRWCLTGTPMMNGVLELYSLLNFLRIKPYCSWEKFRMSFGILFGRNGDPKSVAMNRLRALLKAIMLRRKKDSQLDGKPILRLPEKMEEVVYADLTQDERDFYSQLEKKSQVQFSKYLRDGSIGKNYSSILVLLLRLRQACCHPHLNLDVDDAVPLTNEGMLELVSNLDSSIVARIKEIEAFECPICYDAVQCPSFFIPCGHDSCQQCLTRLVDSAAAMNIQDGNESDRAKCPVCRGLFDPKKCFTYEAFQKVHMPELLPKSEECEAESEDDSDDDDEIEDSADEFDDEVDSKGNLKGFIVQDDFDASDADLSKKRKKGKKKKAEVRPSMLKSLRKEASKNKEAYKKYMQYLRKTWLPAAKVSECMNLLKEIHATGEKTIVFSQWTLLLDLLEVAMWHEKYPGKLRRYDGGMSADQRFASANEFRERGDVTVMLVSLRAGNAGLNLTAASRVIIMDPFWNPYIEMQAVDRAYRIGQQRNVKVYRILTKETVEDRIVDLQNRKKEIVEAALDEAESAKIGRLGVNELKFLFNA